MEYRIRAVWSPDPRFVDSRAITASQTPDGNHTLKICLADEVNCRWWRNATNLPTASGAVGTGSAVEPDAVEVSHSSEIEHDLFGLG
jgi:hypothetical protein